LCCCHVIAVFCVAINFLSVYYFNNMQDLNQTQTILLTLLVSFVTSIATGIITVALMDDQMTGGVTQTINRVVERTIETVVAEKGQSASVVTKEVVVKEENLITDSIAKGSQSLVRLKQTIDTEEGTTEVHVSLGAIVRSDGILVADGAQIIDGATYKGILPDGTTADFKAFDTRNGLSFLKIVSTEKRNNFAEVKFADSNKVNLGQSVVMIYGKDRNVVSMGIISSMRKNEDGSTASFQSTLAGSDIYGSPVMNIFGEVVGIRLQLEGGEYILASNEVTASLKAAVLKAGL